MISTDLDEEETFDLTGVLKHRMLGLKYDYVLIIEWLFDSDERTGAEIQTGLLRKIPAGMVEYVQCRSRTELNTQLIQAQRRIPTRGIPIVHIEAHGDDPGRGQVPRGFVGPNGNGGRELLQWEQLGDAVRALNIASRFNLLLVGAACYGEGLILGASGGRPMPFVAVVGYTDTISPLSLKHALLELYRSLLLDKAELGLAVEAANREHHSADDAILRATSMVALVAEGFIEGSATSILKLRAQFPLDPASVIHSLPSTGLASVSPRALQLLRSGLAAAWSQMWMLTEISENARRFAIDGDRLIELAIAYADRRGVEKVRCD